MLLDTGYVISELFTDLHPQVSLTELLIKLFQGIPAKIQDLPPHQRREWMAIPAFCSHISDLREEAVTPTWGAVKLYPEEAVCMDYIKSLKRKAVLCSLMPALETQYQRGSRMCPAHQSFTFYPQSRKPVFRQMADIIKSFSYNTHRTTCSSRVWRKQSTGSRGLSVCLSGTAVLYALSLGTQ